MNTECERRLDAVRFLLESERCYPVGAERLEGPLAEAARSALCRLPGEVFEHVETEMYFVAVGDESLAEHVNVCLVVGRSEKLQRRLLSVVVVAPVWREMPQRALVGLLAHEIAHGCIEGRLRLALEHEKQAEELAAEWGFGVELAALLEYRQQRWPELWPSETQAIADASPGVREVVRFVRGRCVKE
ncbi:MAG: hypothetical protein GW911_28700 [Armatimonadetes bacterium]|nr:hypothetical protein [Armatimonadota bacterium]PIU93015.1 MAG: hypothetical protein COS65_14900 [Armatimonadetes bacterium CG06_land_8_20_14_3_00_66_21]PJB65195.1 MAG: hypothetical protein CO096_18890 [Armatimonadetes bacterium CG_4_9_14_3_um_filter_66_14]